MYSEERYSFGASFTRRLFPLDGDNFAYELPTQSPTIYIFSDMPTRAEAAAGTGALETISSWTENASSPYDRSWTVSAIDDPDATSGTQSKRYYEAINYDPGSGTAHVIIRSFILQRLEALDEVPGTTVADLKEVYPAIDNYASDSELANFLQVALEEMIIDMESSGIPYSRVSQLSKTKLALAYKTIVLVSASQVKNPADRFVWRVEHYAKKAKDILNGLQLPVDVSGDGVPDAVTPAASMLVIER